MTLQEAIQHVIDKHDGVRNAARAAGCDPGYLSHLRAGHYQHPSDDLLRRLGLVVTVTYEVRK